VGRSRGKVRESLAGVRSGLSYCGAHTIGEARQNARFVEVGALARELEGTHSVRTDVDR
jgi:IMP dehydrogenase